MDSINCYLHFALNNCFDILYIIPILKFFLAEWILILFICLSHFGMYAFADYNIFLSF